MAVFCSDSSPSLGHIRCSGTLFIKKPTNGAILERFRNVLKYPCDAEDNILSENKATVTQNMFKMSPFGVNGF